MKHLKVSHFRIRLNAKSSLEDFLDVPIPEALVKSIESRKIQFAAGRACAYRCLQAFGRYKKGDEIPIGNHGVPIWPPGILGSITHTRYLARAALADCNGLDSQEIAKLGLGIDSEVIMPQTVADRVSRMVLTEKDQELMAQTRTLEGRIFVTCAFSLKESLYKALHPIFPEIPIGFRSIEVVSIQLDKKEFIARLPGAPQLGVLVGQVYLEDGHANTEYFHGFKPLLAPESKEPSPV